MVAARRHRVRSRGHLLQRRAAMRPLPDRTPPHRPPTRCGHPQCLPWGTFSTTPPRWPTSLPSMTAAGPAQIHHPSRARQPRVRLTGRERVPEHFGAAAAPAGTTWYSFDLGSWHVVALIPTCDQVGGCGRKLAPRRWLAADLDANPTNARAAIWHHPAFSSARGGGYRIRTVVEHRGRWRRRPRPQRPPPSVQRFAAMGAGGSSNPARGAREIVVGTGGKDLEAFGPAVTGSEFRLSTFGVLQLPCPPRSTASGSSASTAASRPGRRRVPHVDPFDNRRESIEQPPGGHAGRSGKRGAVVACASESALRPRVGRPRHGRAVTKRPGRKARVTDRSLPTAHPGQTQAAGGEQTRRCWGHHGDSNSRFCVPPSVGSASTTSITRRPPGNPAR